MREHVTQIVLRVDAIELSGSDERVNGRGAVAAGVSAGEQIIFASRPAQCFRSLAINASILSVKALELPH